ncbi:MAG: twin-arginine translocase TatA/TatE family subunit [candidate division Zixibacteria bacterium]|nr:twin-arginine translocase TatA/TatE family subunit [candidate division Zixibacteria bacterium]
MIGTSEWLVIAVVGVILLFGAKKIPELARGLGRSVSEFKKGVREGEEPEDKSGGAPADKPKDGKS